MDFYTEGFSAVNFDCNLNNFRIGTVNLSDALKLIEEITAPGVQVEMIQIVIILAYKIASLSIWVIGIFQIIIQIKVHLTK